MYCPFTCCALCVGDLHSIGYSTPCPCAVLCCAGEAATLNPVEPLVPAGYVQGELRLPSQKAAAAVKAAAQAAGLSESVIQGIKVVSHSSIHYA